MQTPSPAATHRDLADLWTDHFLAQLNTSTKQPRSALRWYCWMALMHDRAGRRAGEPGFYPLAGRA